MTVAQGALTPPHPRSSTSWGREGKKQNQRSGVGASQQQGNGGQGGHHAGTHTTRVNHNGAHATREAHATRDHQGTRHAHARPTKWWSAWVGRPVKRVEEWGTWASRTRKRSDAGGGRLEGGGAWFLTYAPLPPPPMYNVQWREASRRRQSQANQHHGLVPTSPPPHRPIPCTDAWLALLWALFREGDAGLVHVGPGCRQELSLGVCFRDLDASDTSDSRVWGQRRALAPPARVIIVLVACTPSGHSFDAPPPPPPPPPHTLCHAASLPFT